MIIRLEDSPKMFLNDLKMIVIILWNFFSDFCDGHVNISKCLATWPVTFFFSPRNRFYKTFFSVSINDTEQTENTYKLNACNKALVKNQRSKLKRLRLTYLNHILIFVIVN